MYGFVFVLFQAGSSNFNLISQLTRIEFKYMHSYASLVRAIGELDVLVRALHITTSYRRSHATARRWTAKVANGVSDVVTNQPYPLMANNQSCRFFPKRTNPAKQCESNEPNVEIQYECSSWTQFLCHITISILWTQWIVNALSSKQYPQWE